MKIKIIGLGNILAGDDAVGNLVARQLRSYENSSVSIIEGGLATLNLLYAMEDTDSLILIDAIFSLSEAGRIHRFAIPQDLTEIGAFTWSSSTSSTHAFGLGEVLMLAETLNLLPKQVILYGLELGGIQPGAPLSPVMSKSIPLVVSRIVNEELRPGLCTNSN